MRRPARAFAAFCVGLVLGGGWAIAEAQTEFKWPVSNKVLVRDSTGTARLISLPTGTGVTATGNGGATLNGAARLGVGGAQANLAVSRAITPANIAKAVVPLARVAGPVALAGLVYEGVRWYNGDWYEAPDVPGTFDEQLSLPITEGQYMYRSGVGDMGSSPICTGGRTYKSDALDWTEPSVLASPTVPHLTVAEYEGEPGKVWQRVGTCGLPPNHTNQHIIFARPYCPAGSTPSKGSGTLYGCEWPQPCAPGAARNPDGTCGAGGERADDAKLVISFQQGLINQSDLADDVVRNALERGVSADAFEPGPHTITGPSSVEGGTKTSTSVGPTGTTTTITNTTYNLSYTNNTINVTSTTTTTTTHPDGSTETTTEETEVGDGEGEEPPGDKVEEETPDFCEVNPDASACQELGEPEEFELDEEDRDLSFDQELSDAGSCPPPEPFAIQGKTYAMSWQPVCDFATGIRPVVLALSWLAAGAFVFAVGSRSA